MITWNYHWWHETINVQSLDTKIKLFLSDIIIQPPVIPSLLNRFRKYKIIISQRWLHFNIGRTTFCNTNHSMFFFRNITTVSKFTQLKSNQTLFSLFFRMSFIDVFPSHLWHVHTTYKKKTHIEHYWSHRFCSGSVHFENAVSENAGISRINAQIQAARKLLNHAAAAAPAL